MRIRAGGKNEQHPSKELDLAKNMNREALGKGILAGITVLDLADEKGSFCSKLLADLGATVIKIEPPEGNPERKIGPFYRTQAGEHVSLSFAYHNSNKFGLVLDPWTAEGKKTFLHLVQKADVLVETFSSNRLGKIDLSPQQLRRTNPELIHLSITGFGRSGPKRNFHFSDLVGSAAGGQIYLSGPDHGPPCRLPGLQSCYSACLHGAIAVLLSLRKKRLTGRGSYIDLSIQEAVVSTLDNVMINYFREGHIAKRQGCHYEGNYFSIIKCKNGFCQISILGNWETLLELLTCEQKCEDLLRPQWRRPEYRQNRYDYIFNLVERWAHSWDKEQLFELGQTMRFPWAPVVSPDEVLGSPQLKARRFFIPLSLPGTSLTTWVPRVPYKFSRLPSPPLRAAPSLGEYNEIIIKQLNLNKNQPAISRGNSSCSPTSSGILKGIRVVDLTRMVSGPLATRILADFGAEVIKIQSSTTAQGAEHNEAIPFAVRNRNKRSICLNLNQQAARKIFRRLVAISDVVVENYSPRVMANWNLTYHQLKRVRSDVIMASISAMGHSGPWKNYVAFAPTIHALSGFLFSMPHRKDHPTNLAYPYGDVVAGLYAAYAILAALEYRERTGKGCHIDLSAYEALCTLLGPEYMKSALSRKARSKRTEYEYLPQGAPEGCYPCKGNDRWCVISIQNDKQWKDFCRIAKQSEFLSARYSTKEARIKNRIELDKLIAQWTVHQNAEDLVGRLQKAAIAAAAVHNAADLAKDKHLISRNFFISLQHPGLGTIRCDRSSLWPWRESTAKWKAAPLLGQDNHYVFAELLEMSDADIVSLKKQGVIR